MTTLRTIFTSLAVALALAAAAATDARAASLDDGGYLRIADRMQRRIDDSWDERARYYRVGSGGVEPMTNAFMLLMHAVAAMRGHQGPSRNDRRARLIAERLVQTPPFVTTPSTKDFQAHAPGWTNSMSNSNGNQHLVFDAEVVDGLVYAWRARKALELPRKTSDAIASAIRRTADGAFWRYPAIRLNQINWYALVYAAASEVTGTTARLRHDLRAQLVRFLGGVRGYGAAAGTFGAGLRFHYLPHARLTHPMNVDSAEYANVVLSFSRHYEQARAAGMQPPGSAQLRLLRQWVLRALAGYWTHGGYLNWDSGLGFERWHQAKKLGLAQEALIGIATSEALQPSSAAGRWAKYMLDRGLLWFDRIADRAEGGIPDGVLFGVNVVPQARPSARMAVARIGANAARAVAAGMGAMRSEEPPALYAFDPDIGRLAITTPAYNTAVVAVNQKAFPYGGIDMARLYDGEQDVAANVGGTGAAAFGMLLRDRNGKRVAASQTARAAVSRFVTPLRLTKAPAGTGAIASARADRAFAGAFKDLRATGSTRTGGYAFKTEHRFTPGWIQTRWTARRTDGSQARHHADVTFPSYGRRAAVTLVLRDGRAVRLGGTSVALAKVAYAIVRSEYSGYVVVPRSRPAGAIVHLIQPKAQPSAPRAGASLAIQVARDARIATASFTARIAVVRDPAQITTVAERLARRGERRLSTPRGAGAARPGRACRG